MGPFRPPLGDVDVTAPQPVFRFDIAPMTAADLPAAADLSRGVGWPHRQEDWRFVLDVGAGFSAYSAGRLVGTAMWWTCGPQHTRIGMVIVDPAIQRAGIGRTLMDAVVDQVQTPSILLNATKAGEPLYRRMGFQPVGTIVQHQGASFASPIVALPAGMRIRPMGRSDAAVLIGLDAEAFGTPREALIRLLIKQGDAVILVRGEEPVGFSFHRRFGRGHVIGPVVARDVDLARALVAHWVGTFSGAFQRIDVPGDSSLSAWLEEIGLVRVSGALSMARGAALPEPCGLRVHALASQALG
jgi:GNAT superfamily N-acetyltransferase